MPLVLYVFLALEIDVRSVCWIGRVVQDFKASAITVSTPPLRGQPKEACLICSSAAAGPMLDIGLTARVSRQIKIVDRSLRKLS